MHILGVSAFYHDSAACLVRDGEVVAAAQEERFSRTKHDAAFPTRAVEYCLGEAGIGLDELDLVAFYDKPLLKFDRLLESYLAYAPLGFAQFRMGLPLWLNRKLHIPREIDRALHKGYRGRYVFMRHHESHAASAFFPSPFSEAAILTIDGVGEWTTASIGLGRGNRIELVQELRFPHSLGLLYSAFTNLAGFKVNSGEHKLMGLAPYGKPVYRELILANLLDLKLDGSFRLNMDYFAFAHREAMTSAKLHALFGGPPRDPESEITEREMNLAASIQAVTEEVVLRMARHANSVTKQPRLVLAGGVALNCVANGKVLREGPFDEVWIQPAAGDAGGALGAALFVWHQLLDRPRVPRSHDALRGSLLGPRYSSAEVRSYLDRVGAVYHQHGDDNALCDAVAELIADGRVVGHFAGRMEFGPRALGNRSILGDPRSPTLQSVMNVKVKARESFRPFAPAVLREHVHDYFDTRPHEDSPYMLLVAPLRADKRRDVDPNTLSLRDRVRQVRSVVPAITHVDYSARIQTLDPERQPRLCEIVRRFKDRTGCPMVINTSFNVRGEPIVNTPEEAYRGFMATDMDALVLEDCILLRAEQPEQARVDRAAHLRAFALD